MDGDGFTRRGCTALLTPPRSSARLRREKYARSFLVSQPPHHGALTEVVRDLFAADERPEDERERLCRLVALFASLPPPPDPFALYPEYSGHKDRLLAAILARRPAEVEERLLGLYGHLHGYEVPLTSPERQRFRQTHGYLCHAGGLSPILKAGPFLSRDTVTADFGAGNGLQGLLLQVLSPHRRIVQVEISSRLVAAGRELQAWLGIPPERVDWAVGDVTGFSPAGVDFAYLYRPVRPIGEGRVFYETFARQAVAGAKPRVIFSIADCLRDFLPPSFEVFYSDGHLTCFRRVP